MSDLTEPIDSLHLACLQARKRVNAMFLEAKIRVAKWEPKPCPKQ